MRIKDFEKMVLVKRLQSQGKAWWKGLGKKEAKDIIKKAKLKNKGKPKGMELPKHKDICYFLDRLASQLYIYLSRPEIQSLPKLGILMEHLSSLIS